MSEYEFTPGPWTVEEAASASGMYAFYHVRDAAGLQLAQLVCDADEYPRTEADARLMAAAPELFRAAWLWKNRCETLMETNPELVLEPEYEVVRAAIAKALGEQS